MKVMFICTGNICRSAMAHRMLEKRVKDLNRDDIEVYSCGVFAYNGDEPTNQGIEVMKNYAVDLKAHRATNIHNSNIEDMDIILCATTSHKNNVINMYPDLEEKIFTIKEYVGYNKEDLDIADPWGLSTKVYENCAEEIDDCVEKIIDKI
ncbi:MAG: low molecular weight protein arginine phosphatase [Clostridiales bacterium]|nr:low molecular weight protein arginine phosphatase [Clostridiales bacterium]